MFIYMDISYIIDCRQKNNIWYNILVPTVNIIYSKLIHIQMY